MKKVFRQVNCDTIYHHLFIILSFFLLVQMLAQRDQDLHGNGDSLLARSHIFSLESPAEKALDLVEKLLHGVVVSGTLHVFLP